MNETVKEWLAKAGGAYHTANCSRSDQVALIEPGLIPVGSREEMH